MTTMDALALLCNLHADGPVTLQRLRRCGFDSLPALLEVESEELVVKTGWEERVAERFLREAWCLAERLDEGLLEEDEEEEELHDLESAAFDEDAFEDAEEELEDEADEPLLAAELAPPAAGPGRDGRDGRKVGQGVERVLGAWRDLDAEAPPPPAQRLVPAPDLLQPASKSGSPRGPLGGRLGSPHTPLERLPDLAPEHLAALRRAGLSTCEELTAASTLELAQRLGLGFTRVSRLQFLARRAASAVEAPPSEQRPVFPSGTSQDGRWSSYVREEVGPDSPAGPFAND